MGKRVNFADLATDDFYEPPASPVRLVSDADRAAPDGTTRVVPIAEVTTNPLNKRPAGQDDELAGMAETIRQHGIIQPLVVCSTQAYLARFPDQDDAVRGSRWVALIGNRRLLAARAAGRTEVSLVVHDEQVSSMYEVMLIENGQRRELPPLLEAEAMAEVLRSTSISQRELARRIGKSHVYISQRLALLTLIGPLRAALERGELTIEQAREFGELPEAEQRRIADAGAPYRRAGGNGVNTRARLRTIRVSTPAVAAESIRGKFDAEELAELVRLLSEHLRSVEQPED